eukprot:315171-Rhodomonas_salina.2
MACQWHWQTTPNASLTRSGPDSPTATASPAVNVFVTHLHNRRHCRQNRPSPGRVPGYPMIAGPPLRAFYY